MGYYSSFVLFVFFLSFVNSRIKMSVSLARLRDVNAFDTASVSAD